MRRIWLRESLNKYWAEHLINFYKNVGYYTGYIISNDTSQTRLSQMQER